MTVHFYALCVEADRVVAAEIGDAKAAQRLDAGLPLLLATEAELNRLARAWGKSRTVVFRAAPRRPAAAGSHAAAAALSRVA